MTLQEAVQNQNKKQTWWALRQPQEQSSLVESLGLAQDMNWTWGIRQLVLASPVDWNSFGGRKVLARMIVRYLKHEGDDVSVWLEKVKSFPPSEQKALIKKFNRTVFQSAPIRSTHPLPPWSPSGACDPLDPKATSLDRVLQKIWSHPGFVEHRIPRPDRFFCNTVVPVALEQDPSPASIAYLWQHLTQTMLAEEWLDLMDEFTFPVSHATGLSGDVDPSRIQACQEVLLNKPSAWWEDLRHHFLGLSPHTQDKIIHFAPSLPIMFEKMHLHKTLNTSVSAPSSHLGRKM